MSEISKNIMIPFQKVSNHNHVSLLHVTFDRCFNILKITMNNSESKRNTNYVINHITYFNELKLGFEDITEKSSSLMIIFEIMSFITA